MATFTDLTVLYLEDEPLIAFDTTQMLEDLGFDEVKQVFRLKNAEQAAQARTFDVAILDINVDQNQTSIEFGETLRTAGTTVIFASGNGHQADDLRNDGFVFIDKPFAQRRLTDAISEALAA